MSGISQLLDGTYKPAIYASLGPLTAPLAPFTTSIQYQNGGDFADVKNVYKYKLHITVRRYKIILMQFYNTFIKTD